MWIRKCINRQIFERPLTGFSEKVSISWFFLNAPYGFVEVEISGINCRIIVTGQELRQELMSPYLQNTGASFSNGVNFASSGSTAVNSSFVGDGSNSQGLFSLYVQVDQFRVFHQRALSQHSQQGPKLFRLHNWSKSNWAVWIWDTIWCRVPIHKFHLGICNNICQIILQIDFTLWRTR